MSDKPSIEIPFAIGETVWWTGHGSREETITCPDCNGECALTVINGHDEAFRVPCQNCTRGYEGPFGYVKRVVYERKPTPFTCNRVEVRGDEVRYSEQSPEANCWSSADASDLFRDKDECAARCVEINEAYAAEMEERNTNQIARNRKRVLWSYTYWSRQIKDIERQLELARERLKKCNKPTRKPKGATT